VLIVGGGAAGLTASMLLSTMGIPALLVSRLEATSIHPKAHVLHQRTMEIFTQLGVAEAIYAAGCPPEQMSHTGWYRGFAGEDPDAGRRIAKLECWGAGYTDPAWVAASPCRQTNLPQIRLEPLLLARAQELSPDRVRFGHELVSLESDEAKVSATIRVRATGATYRVRADYALGCDGGRTVGAALGITMDGPRDLMRSVSVHMTADLSRWLGDEDEDVLIRWILHPELGERFSVLVPMGPERWGASSEEWVLHMNFPIEEDPLYDSDEKVLAQLRLRLGLPDIDPEIHVITRWSMEGLLASAMRVGRIFLLGDAAHRHPPTGGLGLNSAVQDAYNLCWKLGLVLRGVADPGLLESFALERLPVDARNTERSVQNALNHATVVRGVGIDPAAEPDANQLRSRAFWEAGPAGDALRSSGFSAIASQSMEFNEPNVELGYAYESNAVVPDGSARPEPIDPIHVYEPSTRPGSPLPHAWVDRHGERRALRDLQAPAGFLFVAGEGAGRAWCDAARTVGTELDLELTALVLSHLVGDWLDPRCAWIRQRGHGPEGAVLVRPDRTVGWRAMQLPANPEATLREALQRILGLAA
jgi:2,4-dichlorophenol 6-monooxygenase